MQTRGGVYGLGPGQLDRLVVVFTSAIGEMWKSLDHSVMCTAGLGAGAKALLAASSRVSGCSSRLVW